MNDSKKIVIIEQLKEEIRQATLKKEGEKRDSLKYLLSLLEKESYRQADFDNAKAMALLSGEMKRKKEALVLFEKGKREDLVKKEKQEIEWLGVFLPTPLSEEEIKTLVKKVAKEGMAFGQIMGQVMSQVQGRATGELVAKVVKQELGG